MFDVLQQKKYLVATDVFRGAWVGWTENVILTFCVTNWVWILPLNKYLWKIPNFLRLWTATSLILPSFTKNYCLNNYISHHNNLQNVKWTFERMKMVLNKGFYYYFCVIHFWSLFPLLFKKLKKVSWFLKTKIRVSSLRNVSHWSLSSVYWRLNVYRRALILRNLSRGSCPETFLVTRLMWTNRILTQITFTCSK